MFFKGTNYSWYKCNMRHMNFLLTLKYSDEFENISKMFDNKSSRQTMTINSFLQKLCKPLLEKGFQV